MGDFKQPSWNGFGLYSLSKWHILDYVVRMKWISSAFEEALTLKSALGAVERFVKRAFFYFKDVYRIYFDAESRRPWPRIRAEGSAW